TMLHSNANEIDLQAPYLFNYVGEPSLTQKWVPAAGYGEHVYDRWPVDEPPRPAAAAGEPTAAAR
ncbi:hypothetical protein, partial [Streptomyces minutiscleroticus]|uniref:hypothetical protein n=1 Tax=Streptomyces minutiscleroticus TaxID=68238 RepID=UPI003331A5E1